MQFNKDCGEVDSGWGAIPVMVFAIVMFVLFLVILLQIYNSSIILANVDIDWSDLVFFDIVPPLGGLFKRTSSH